MTALRFHTFTLASCFTVTMVFSIAMAGSLEASETYPLMRSEQTGQTTEVSAELEVGGDLIVRPTDDASLANTTTRKLPLNVTAKLKYQEQALASGEAPRSLRKYSEATATLKTDEQGVERTLPANTIVLCQRKAGRTNLEGVENPLTREQFDLLNVFGNTLVLDALLPNKSLAEGDSWEHDKEAIAAVLGMDHVAVCEVSSVVLGSQYDQVQLRLAGKVHGRIDGAATELEVKGAYLYHLKRQRITKCNLVVKDKRSASEVTPGLDVIAKLTLTIAPAEQDEAFPAETVAAARSQKLSSHGKLLLEAPQRGYRFSHSADWYTTAEQRDLLSMRLLDGGELVAHCNVSTLPARSAGRATTLEQFKRDVQKSLGKNAQTIIAANEWTTPAGHKCLGVFANGNVEDVAVQWRYYLVADENLPRISVAVTVEQSLVERFANADRAIVDSMELVEKAATETAAKGVRAR